MNEQQRQCVHRFTAGSQRAPGWFTVCGTCSFERTHADDLGAAPTHYVVRNSAAVFVKAADFFRSQGGLVEDWGRNWCPVVANSIGDARRKGAKMFSMTLSHIYAGEA